MESNLSLIKKFLVIALIITLSTLIWLLVTPSLSSTLFFLWYSKQRFILITFISFLFLSIIAFWGFSSNQTFQFVFIKLMSSKITYILFFSAMIILFFFLFGIVIHSYGPRTLFFERITPVLTFGFLLTSELILFQEIISRRQMARSIWSDAKKTIIDNDENRKRIVYLIIFGLGGFIQIFLGNNIFITFIILFFIIFWKLIPKPPYFMILSASIFAIIIISSPTLNTWAYLIESNKTTINRFKPIITEIINPNSGLEVLPVYSQQMLSLLTFHQISKYQVSPMLKFKESLQRIIESAWPKRMDNNAPFILCFLEEIDNYPECKLIDKKGEIALVYCH